MAIYIIPQYTIFLNIDLFDVSVYLMPTEGIDSVKVTKGIKDIIFALSLDPNSKNNSANYKGVHNSLIKQLCLMGPVH